MRFRLHSGAFKDSLNTEMVIKTENDLKMFCENLLFDKGLRLSFSFKEYELPRTPDYKYKIYITLNEQDTYLLGFTDSNKF